jgi:hypothetical protein
MSNELKPCPYCGGFACTGFDERANDEHNWYVICINCHARTGLYDRETAINKWNTRVYSWDILEKSEVNNEEIASLRIRYKEGKILRVPKHCELCKYSKPYGAVGERYCKILEDYITGNLNPPYKERGDCPISDIEFIPLFLRLLDEADKEIKILKQEIRK